MLSKITNFITNIRNADESKRKLWFWILGGGASVIVIFLWLIFFNLNLPTADGYGAQAQGVDEPNKITAKLMEIKNTLSNGLRAVSDKLGFKNRFTIEKSDQEFVLSDLEDVPVAELPK